MYWDVIEVRATALRELTVRFADGLSGDELVGCAKIDNGVLVWPNGLDLAPDTMYWEIKRNPQRRYDLKRK
ncbi:MAG: hypothetical protein ACNA7G_14920 [Methylobacter sp.]